MRSVTDRTIRILYRNYEYHANVFDWYNTDAEQESAQSTPSWIIQADAVFASTLNKLAKFYPLVAMNLELRGYGNTTRVIGEDLLSGIHLRRILLGVPNGAPWPKLLKIAATRANVKKIEIHQLVEENKPLKIIKMDDVHIDAVDIVSGGKIIAFLVSPKLLSIECHAYKQNGEKAGIDNKVTIHLDKAKVE